MLNGRGTNKTKIPKNLTKAMEQKIITQADLGQMNDKAI